MEHRCMSCSVLLHFCIKENMPLIFTFKAEHILHVQLRKIKERQGKREKLGDIISNKKKLCEFQYFPSVVIDCIHKMLSN